MYVLQKSSEDKVTELERLHAEALASKDQELQARLQDQESRVQEQICQAVVCMTAAVFGGG